MRGVISAWLAFTVAATYRWEHNQPGLGAPPASIYVAGSAIFSALGLLAGPAPQFAGLAAWALVAGSLVTGRLLPTGPAAGSTLASSGSGVRGGSSQSPLPPIVMRGPSVSPARQNQTKAVS